jgi:hypothetical protein
VSAGGGIVQSSRFGEAAWLGPRLASFGAWTVRSIVPTGFEAYVRVFHPAGEAEDARTWAQLAERYGRVMHAHAEFERLVPPRERPNVGDPPTGYLWPEQTAALADVTARHTGTPDRCWFCLWEGWGWVQGPPAVGVLAERLQQRRALTRDSPFQLEGGRVSLPGRKYLLFEGPLASVADFGYWIEFPDGRRFFERWSPNIWWPDDRAWCVATETDLDSTYVGGSEDLIAGLLADPRLEALRVDADDVRSDTINPHFGSEEGDVS